jgi:hypothetical protein
VPVQVALALEATRIEGRASSIANLKPGKRPEVAPERAAVKCARLRLLARIDEPEHRVPTSQLTIQTVAADPRGP